MGARRAQRVTHRRRAPVFRTRPAEADRLSLRRPLIWAQAGIEVLGGLALALGAFTRPVAFILSGDMAVAYFMAHFPHSFYPAVNQGDGAVLYCFVFLYFVFAGAGPWSLDAAALSRR
jgi:putative oxidoreductase